MTLPYTTIFLAGYGAIGLAIACGLSRRTGGALLILWSAALLYVIIGGV